MEPRRVGALALRPTCKAQGGFFFLSLDSGRIINRLHATCTPMPNEVIERVTTLARQQKANHGLMFLDRNKHPQREGACAEEEDHDHCDDKTYQPDDTVSMMKMNTKETMVRMMTAWTMTTQTKLQESRSQKKMQEGPSSTKMLRECRSSMLQASRSFMKKQRKL